MPSPADSVTPAALASLTGSVPALVAVSIALLAITLFFLVQLIRTRRAEARLVWQYEESQAQIRREWVDNNVLVAEVRDSLAPDFKGRHLVWDLQPLPRVFADRTLLRQVWFNLISNAVKQNGYPTRDRGAIPIAMPALLIFTADGRGRPRIAEGR